jgi:2-iminobutanoate/2-iminopropanoate deaminase
VHTLHPIREGPEGRLTAPAAPVVPSTMDRESIRTDAAPQAIGPYSQALSAGPFVFLSGQIGLDPASGTIVAGGTAAETEQVMRNLQAVLQAARLGFDDLVRTTIYLVDLSEFTIVNDIYGRYLEEPFPARATVGVAALPRGARVEIDAIALRKEREYRR